MCGSDVSIGGYTAIVIVQRLWMFLFKRLDVLR